RRAPLAGDDQLEAVPARRELVRAELDDELARRDARLSSLYVGRRASIQCIAHRLGAAAEHAVEVAREVAGSARDDGRGMRKRERSRAEVSGDAGTCEASARLYRDLLPDHCMRLLRSFIR